jgi:microcystin-dependent protein
MKRLLSVLVLLMFLAFPICADATVATSTSRAQYNCNGSTTAFVFTFGVGATSEIQVILTSPAGVETTLTETTNYTVACTNSDCTSGGTVTTLSTYATGNTITILRNVPLTQEADFTEGMPTLYESFETGLDKLTRIAQQHEERLNRSVVVPKSETTSGMMLPAAATRASRYLAFDASGNPIASAGGPGSADVPVSAWGATLIAATDAAAARDLLSVTAAVTGEIRMYAGSSAPAGWLVCDGSAVSRTTYATLFAVMGTTFGAGDGSTTFNLPNFKGRIPIGVGQGNTAEGGGAGTNRVLGATAGAEKHTQTIGEVGSHGHTATGTDSGHTHGIGFGPASSGSAAADWGASNGVSGYFNSLSSTANISVTVNNSATPTGMDIMNPMVVVTFIIKY